MIKFTNLGSSMFKGKFQETCEYAALDILEDKKWLVIEVNNKISLYSVIDFHKHFKERVTRRCYTWYKYHKAFNTKQCGLEYVYKTYMMRFESIMVSHTRFIQEKRMNVNQVFIDKNNTIRKSIFGEVFKYRNKLDKLYEKFPELLY